MLAYPQSQLINDKEEMLRSICVDAPGFFGADIESGDSVANFAFAKLSQAGYTSVSLVSADEKDWDSRKSLCNTVFPDNTIPNKARHDCLKIARAIHHCKSGIPTKSARDVVAEEAKAATPQGNAWRH